MSGDARGMSGGGVGLGKKARVDWLEQRVVVKQLEWGDGCLVDDCVQNYRNTLDNSNNNDDDDDDDDDDNNNNNTDNNNNNNNNNSNDNDDCWDEI